jgi:hypothetical protein
MEFADVTCAPISQDLAAFLRRLADDGAEHSGEGGNETVREPNPGLIVLPGPQAAINRAQTIALTATTGLRGIH